MRRISTRYTISTFYAVSNSVHAIHVSVSDPQTGNYAREICENSRVFIQLKVSSANVACVYLLGTRGILWTMWLSSGFNIGEEKKIRYVWY